MFRTSFVVALVTGVAAQAQDIPMPVAPPIVAVEEDRSVTMNDDDELLFGPDKHKVTPVELFRALGRTDLVERAQENAKRRLVFAITAAAVAVVGIGAGVGILATTPDVSTGRCAYDVAFYNSTCRAEASLHQVAGATTLGATVLVAGVFASIALWSRPDVFTKAELRQFVDEQNVPAPAARPPNVQLMPAIGPAFSGVVAQGTF